VKRGFNLLKSQAEPPSVWSKVYDWALGTARIVIIVVLIIVLIAFGFRIFIDMQAKALDTQIQQGEAVLNVLSQNETQIRVIQSKTASYAQIWNTTPDYSDVVADINASLPISTSITNLDISINGSSLTISGVADKTREQDIIDLENNLKNNMSYLTSTALEQLQDTSDQLKFNFTANIINIKTKSLSNITDNNAN